MLVYLCSYIHTHIIVGIILFAMAHTSFVCFLNLSHLGLENEQQNSNNCQIFGAPCMLYAVCRMYAVCMYAYYDVSQ